MTKKLVSALTGQVYELENDAIFWAYLSMFGLGLLVGAVVTTVWWLA